MMKRQHKQWNYQEQASGAKQLQFFGQNLPRFIQRRGYKGPMYIYSRSALSARVDEFSQAISEVHSGLVSTHYAMKANSNVQLLKLLRKAGLGIDVVSGGELQLAMQAGFKPQDVLYSGVGKTVVELRTAIKLQVKQINVESLPELIRIGEIATSLRQTANVALRLNPGVDPKTHPYIATGLQENKFGIDPMELPEVVKIIRQYPKLNFTGLSLHIGSQLFDFSAVAEAIAIVRKIQVDLENLGLRAHRLDIGGGIGVDYSRNAELVDHKTLQAFCRQVKKSLRGFEGEICCEPGRYLVARAGTLVGEVQYIKTTPYKKFVIIDTGMHHLLRPALYQAKHRILALTEPQQGSRGSWDVVGPVCESSDVLATQVRLRAPQAGDWLAIADAGAYGFSMASFYNSFALPEEVFID